MPALSLLLTNGRLGAVPEMWSCLEKQREDIEMVQRGVGRLELMGHPEWDWAGTAFLINETTLMTTRRTAEVFCEMQGQNWTFRPGITAWMDYSCDVPRSGQCRLSGSQCDRCASLLRPGPHGGRTVPASLPAGDVQRAPDGNVGAGRCTWSATPYAIPAAVSLNR